MGRIYHSLEELIGHTPLAELCRLQKKLGIGAHLLAKLESFNPAGSVKDRVALSLILDAERRGLLKPGGTVIEPTSGNTGIGLAAVCAARGYRAVIVMPDSMSRERMMLMRAYGAELVLTDGALGMQGAIDRASELQKETDGAIVAGQFVNPANAEAHRETTGPELFEDTDGDLDILVAGVGTGGTVTGTASYLKSKLPHLHVVAVEPTKSPILSEGKSGAHGLQGIGAGFVPDVLDTTVYDEVLCISEADAYAAARLLGSCEGLLVGISAGAALSAAITVARREENKGKRIAVILPDTGERYLSTPLFAEEG